MNRRARFGVLRVVMRRSLVAALFVVTACSRSPVAPPRHEPRSAQLEAQLAKIAARVDGTYAATIVRLPSGERVSVNGARRVPMMSVFKLPLVIVTLSQIEAGARARNEPVAISPREIRSHVSPIADAWKRGEHAPSLESMMRMALVASDNTAGDKLVTSNGGGASITRRLGELGIAGVDIAEEEIDIAARIECPGTPRPPEGWSEETFGKCPEPPLSDRVAAAKREAEAPPNGATTDALAEMLIAIDRGTILTSADRDWLLDALKATNTGPSRLRAGLPTGTPLAHRTGTGDTVDDRTIATNDIGIAWLPDGTRLVMAVAVANARGDDAVREAAIADTARAAWEIFSR